MNWKRFTSSVLAPLCLFVWSIEAQSQDLTPWTAHPYGNEWINYSKKYVRVGVPADGVYKISLSALNSKVATYPGYNPATDNFTKDNVQIWHRGKEVAVISTDNNEVVFYGLKNDGASDGLMFRPGPEARLNPYVSFFSEEGSYFFTVSSAPTGPKSQASTPSAGATYETYHWQTLLKKYDVYEPDGRRRRPPFAFSTFGAGNTINQSYYVDGNGYTSSIIYTPGLGATPESPIGVPVAAANYLRESIQLVNWNSNGTPNPKLEFLMQGQNEGSRRAQVFVSPDEASITNSEKQVSLTTFPGFTGQKITGKDLVLNTHLSPAGTGFIQFQKEGTPNNYDWYGVGYYKIEYPQLVQMTGTNTYNVFNFASSPSETVNVEIKNVPSDYKAVNITDPYAVTQLTGGEWNAGVLRLTVTKGGNKPLKLLVYSVSAGIKTASAIYDVDYREWHESTTSTLKKVDGTWNPEAYDYLIITSNKLKAKAIEYSQYRGSLTGGNYRVLTVDIRNLYNQFNYGEPSAVAIRRFVNFMLKNGVRLGKHNLLLLGNSISIPIGIFREMPDEVPTWGDPGSDILLVAGLYGTDIDSPIIPVGRVSALNSTELGNYLAKVKEYELQTATGTKEQLSWRKKVVHIVGAKLAYEVPQFSGFFGEVSPYVTQLDNERTTTLLTNEAAQSTTGGNASVTTAPIAPLVNQGVGMLTYYGHGNQNETVYNIRKISSSSDFTDSHKYSFIYFNGCGVGNIFTSPTVHSLSTDWLVTANKGGIAIFGNSYKSYVSPTRVYLNILYKHLFLKSDAARKTAGQVLMDVDREFMGLGTGARIQAGDPFTYSNVHQTNLYGDPALKILISTPADVLPVELIDFSAKLLENKSVQLNWSTGWEVNNNYFLVERSYNGKDFQVLGKVPAKKGGDGKPLAYDFIDNAPMGGLNYYRLKQVDLGSLNDEGQYSSIISVYNENSEALTVYPNPTFNDIEIKMNLPTTIKSWVVRDLNGRVVETGKGTHAYLKNTPAGSYFIEIGTANGDLFSRQIIKR